jgi:hypothetical protein
VNAKLVERLARLQYRNTDDLDKKARASLEIHSSPAFGWRIASTYARARLPFPLTVTGRDRWLFIAYMALLNPAVHSDRHVEEARQIHQNPGTSAKLKALLIAGLGQPVNDHLNIVAEKTGIPRRTVEAFEILFFNVLDRSRDGAYISEIVYPQGRVVEVLEDYFQTASTGDLLIRAAYNHRDIDLVLRLAGMTDEACKKELLALHESMAKLEGRIMGNALLMTKLGLVNQRSVGLQRATSLLAASRRPPNKADEEVAQNPHDTSAELAAALEAMPTITEAERRKMHAVARPGMQVFSDEDGTIYTCCDSDNTSGGSNPAWPVDPSEPSIERFPEPIHAVWKNKECDQPVVIIARMFQPGMPDYYQTDYKTGIPASEVFFE